MSTGSTATKTRTVGGRLSTSAAPGVRGVACPRRRRRRTRGVLHQPPRDTARGYHSRAGAGPTPRERSRRAAVPSAPDASRLQASAASPDSTSRRGGSDRRRRARAPTRPHAVPLAPPRECTAAPRPRPRSVVLLPSSTSVDANLPARGAAVIPASLMGHGGHDEHRRRSAARRHARQAHGAGGRVVQRRLVRPVPPKKSRIDRSRRDLRERSASSLQCDLFGPRRSLTMTSATRRARGPRATIPS